MQRLANKIIELSRMPSDRLLLRATLVAVCMAMMAMILSSREAGAQGLKPFVDPYADVDFESLKTKRNSVGVPPTTEQMTPRNVEKVFDNGNSYAVRNRPKHATVFKLNRATRITKITTYHWNNARGAQAGTISLQSGSGQTLGPWRARGQPGQGGVPNVYWVAEVNIILPPGTFKVIDSDNATWAQNDVSGGAGITTIIGYAVGSR
jgi:hypothetical protein